MNTVADSSSLQTTLDEILDGDWRDARKTAIDAMSGGFAMSPVVCTRCSPDRPMTFVGAVRHLMQVESDRAAAHPDLAYSPLHRRGDFRSGLQGEVAPEPWTSAPCRYCRSPIIWALTSRNNKIPIDEATNRNGTVLLVAMNSDGLGDPYAHFLHTERERFTVDRSRLHTLHVNTCTKPPAPPAPTALATTKRGTTP